MPEFSFNNLEVLLQNMEQTLLGGKALKLTSKIEPSASIVMHVMTQCLP